MKKTKKTAIYSSSNAFSFIELLLTIVLIGILAKIAISNFAGAVPDSSRVVARQQQAVLQGAMNCWLSAQLSTPGSTISGAYATYSGYSAADKITNCLQRYLATEAFTAASPTFTIEANNTLTTSASRQINSHFQILAWPTEAPPAGSPPGTVGAPTTTGPVIQFVTTSTTSSN
jgi:prepilin-type N-terminal cleavage/methylation domain-containing protein